MASRTRAFGKNAWMGIVVLPPQPGSDVCHLIRCRFCQKCLRLFTSVMRWRLRTIACVPFLDWWISSNCDCRWLVVWIEGVSYSSTGVFLMIVAVPQCMAHGSFVDTINRRSVCPRTPEQQMALPLSS